MPHFHSHGCNQGAWQLCLGCGAKVCACRGSARGQCPECYRGLLTGFYSLSVPLKCGYKGCSKAAVAATPRVGRACYAHAVEKGGYAPGDVAGDGKGMPTAYTQQVLRAFGYAERADTW